MASASRWTPDKGYHSPALQVEADAEALSDRLIEELRERHILP
jgi:hypothetical protein